MEINMAKQIDVTYGQTVLAQANYVEYPSAITWVYGSALFNTFKVLKVSNICDNINRALQKEKTKE